jgi:hypothetical protein
MDRENHNHLLLLTPSLKGKDVMLHTMKVSGGRGGIAPTHSQPWH